MNFIPSSMRKLVFTAAIITCFGGVSLFVQQSYMQKATDLNNVNTGLETCFNRVAQTFTAIMIQQSNSPYLGEEFLSMSSDCFSEVAKLSGELSLGGETLNKLVSDTHWFHEKIKKSQKFILNSDQETSQSNIDEKFANLEELKDKFQESVFAMNAQVISKVDMFKLITALCFAAFAGVLILGLSLARKIRAKVSEVESMAKTISEKEQINTTEFDGIIDMALTEVNMPNTLGLVKKYCEGLAIAVEELPDLAQIKEVEDVRPSTNLNSIFDVSLKGIQNKAFTQGIILDFDLLEEMSVYGEQEGISQLFYSLMNYSVDSSLKHNLKRKVVVRSTLINDQISLTFTIHNYLFSAQELELLEAQNNPAEIDPNILMLKEVTDLLGLQLQFKNQIKDNLKCAQFTLTFDKAPITLEKDTFKAAHADQLELKFDYVKTQAPKKVTVLKGSKKAILEQINNQKSSEV